MGIYKGIGYDIGIGIFLVVRAYSEQLRIIYLLSSFPHPLFT